MWLHDKDGYIYRVLNDGQEERLQCTHPAIEKYLTMHKEDVKKWTDLLVENCECSAR